MGHHHETLACEVPALSVLDDDPKFAQLKILRKPYRQADLVTALREVFAGPAAN
jgi:hypothetical protein